MPQYPTKQIAPYQGPGWYQPPPSAGGLVPGAGAKERSLSKEITNLSESLVGVGILAQESKRDDELHEAQRILVREGEAKFRAMEKAGNVDWTPTMARGAAELRAMLNAQDVMSQYEKIMGEATLEQMSDPEFPMQEYSKLIDARNASVEQNDYADDVFFKYAVNPGSKGRDMVDYYTAASAKIAKEQGIATMGVAASNWVTETWQQFKDMDAEDPNYTAVREHLFKETKDWVQTFISGDGDSPGARGWGFYTANNGEGAKTLFTSILDGLMTQGVSPADATEFMKTIKVGAHDMAGVANIQKMLAEWEAELPRIQDAWDKRKRASFWNSLDVSIANDPLRFSEEHQHRMLSKKEARDGLDTWYEKEKGRLQNHFGLTDTGNEGEWQSSEQAQYNGYALKIESTYQTYKTRIDTQQQIHQTVIPTVNEIKAFADVKLAEAQEIAQGLLAGVPVGDANFPKGHVGIREGAMAGRGNHQTLIESTAEILATQIDPSTVTTRTPKGTLFGSGAKEYLDRYIYDALLVPLIGSPEAYAEMALILGTQNATTQGLVGTEIANSAQRFLGLGSRNRPGEGLTANLDPRYRSVERGFDELPKDAGEISREDLEDSDLLWSFEVYEIIRGRGEAAVTVLGIKDTPVSNIFYEAWRLRDNKAPAAARLAQAFTRLRIEDLGGETPLTESGREVFSKALREKGLDGHAMSIASTVLDQVWRNMDPGLSAQGKDEALKKWGKTNIGYEDDVFVRIGSPENFYEEQVSEAEFFTLFKEDLEEIVNNPDIHVQFTVLRVGGKTQVIPHAVDDDGNVTDLFDDNIKSVYSQDDLKYLYGKYKADVDYAGFQSQSSLNPVLKRKPRTAGKGPAGSPFPTRPKIARVPSSVASESSYAKIDRLREELGMDPLSLEVDPPDPKHTDPLFQSSRELVKKSEERIEREEAEALKLLKARMVEHNAQLHALAPHDALRFTTADKFEYFPGIPLDHHIESLDEITMVDGIYDPGAALRNSNKLMSKNPGITETPEEYVERIKLHGEEEAEFMLEELGEQTEAIKKLEKGQEKSLLEASAILNEQEKALRKRQAQLNKDDEKLKQKDPEGYRLAMIDRAETAILVAWRAPNKGRAAYFTDLAVTAFLNLSEEDRAAFLDIKGMGDFWSMEIEDLLPHMSGQLVTFKDKFLMAVHRRRPIFSDEDE